MEAAGIEPADEKGGWHGPSEQGDAGRGSLAAGRVPPFGRVRPPRRPALPGLTAHVHSTVAQAVERPDHWGQCAPVPTARARPPPSTSQGPTTYGLPTPGAAYGLRAPPATLRATPLVPLSRRGLSVHAAGSTVPAMKPEMPQPWVVEFSSGGPATTMPWLEALPAVLRHAASNSSHE
jgi:hypothetical protein